MAPNSATLTINGTTVTAGEKQGDYYDHNVAASNTAGPLWTEFTVGSSDTLSSSITRGSFLPQSPELYTYDADGNLLKDGRWHYDWDAENRLITMETIGNRTGDGTAVWTSGVSQTKITFAYDYLGRRIDKKRYTWNGSAWAAVGTSGETRFVYDGWNLLADYDATGGTFGTRLRSYVWGLDLSWTLQGGGGVGGLLATISASGVVNMVAYDGNGNVMGLTDRSTGTVNASYEYSPFGEALRATGLYAQQNPFRFSTKYSDDETGMLYYGSRYYDSKLGRFLGRDPMEERGGINLFAFVNNNPVNSWDVLGHDVNQWNYGPGVDNPPPVTPEEAEGLVTVWTRDGVNPVDNMGFGTSNDQLPNDQDPNSDPFAPRQSQPVDSQPQTTGGGILQKVVTAIGNAVTAVVNAVVSVVETAVEAVSTAVTSVINAIDSPDDSSSNDPNANTEQPADRSSTPPTDTSTQQPAKPNEYQDPNSHFSENGLTINTSLTAKYVNNGDNVPRPLSNAVTPMQPNVAAEFIVSNPIVNVSITTDQPKPGERNIQSVTITIPTTVYYNMDSPSYNNGPAIAAQYAENQHAIDIWSARDNTIIPAIQNLMSYPTMGTQRDIQDTIIKIVTNDLVAANNQTIQKYDAPRDDGTLAPHNGGYNPVPSNYQGFAK